MSSCSHGLWRHMPLACSAHPLLQGHPHFLFLLRTSHVKSPCFWAWLSTLFTLALRRGSVPRLRPMEVTTWHRSPRHLLGSHTSCMVPKAAGLGLRQPWWPWGGLCPAWGGPQHPHRHPLLCSSQEAPVEQEGCFGNTGRCWVHSKIKVIFNFPCALFYCRSPEKWCSVAGFGAAAGAWLKAMWLLGTTTRCIPRPSEIQGLIFSCGWGAELKCRSSHPLVWPAKNPTLFLFSSKMRTN